MKVLTFWWCAIFSCRDADPSYENDSEGLGTSAFKGHSPKLNSTLKPHPWAIFDGMLLILSSSYLMCVALFLWLSAVISSFFYLQVQLFSSMNCIFYFLFNIISVHAISSQLEGKFVLAQAFRALTMNLWYSFYCAWRKMLKIFSYWILYTSLFIIVV